MRRDDLFPTLEPPPGGLALLRERLERRRASRRRWAAVPALAAACGAALLALRPAAPEPLRARLAGDPIAAALGLTEATGPVNVARHATATTGLVALPSGDPDVILYWIESNAR